MSVKLIINMLIFMIVMQSGIVAADIHTYDSKTSQEHQLVLDDSNAIQQANNASSHDAQSTGDCDFCMHCQCSHFIAIFNIDGINVAAIPYNYFNLHPRSPKPDFTVSMYRPPRS
ncbi:MULTISPECIES: hypothetical protein [Methylophaga]|jgi:hypothetical protein|uniref:hypothetical protein n=1 Tax=Methylophaga TaxID=40222 RepID=UPI001CF43608|nr:MULTISPECIES: hypothetical protein [Methylophaga]MBL1456391.1 hypothetical protein [Methylophaga sp.]MCB2426111.1 hypothetical protein [Methylophaga pinxianii]MDO8827790.1 hypothetical protein [Methylophaga sp.]MDX1750706.1 hypothetical protein [Methylophaga sp.]UPH47364.1 hypothetical protein LGT42_015100 [Methylophaga pinxianii]|tara:strand:- start:4340 stop:4684 length:345 start_codon:yes stop_codon:yes gene_type:complete